MCTYIYSPSKNIRLSFSYKANTQLQQLSLANLANGGRGIGNIVENFLINPLSRFLFDNEILKDANVKITTIIDDTEITEIAAIPANLTCEFERL